jgi:hypothetical protein
MYLAIVASLTGVYCLLVGIVLATWSRANSRKHYEAWRRRW